MGKKLAFVLTAMLLFCGSANLASAYQRTVLVENFTNWG
jgi:hypothetical protein